MTTGFQQQQTSFSPILRAAPRPQNVGAKLVETAKTELPAPEPEPASFAKTR